MDPLKSGRYYITNVRYENRAILPNAKTKTPIVARAGDDSPGEKVNRDGFVFLKATCLILHASLSGWSLDSKMADILFKTARTITMLHAPFSPKWNTKCTEGIVIRPRGRDNGSG
jgi:hypothetical protein